MKSYAPNDIKLRMVRKLKEYSNWTKVIEDSAIDSILTAHAEALSETNRHFEHERREKTWDFAQDRSSILGQVKYFGYKPRRKVSSIGYVYFSHDININSITFESELEDLTEYEGSSIPIPLQTPLLINQIPFVTSKEFIYEPGLKYIKVPVIQGVPRNISTVPQKTLGLPFEKIRINNSNVEAAIDLVSKEFFSVQIQLPSNTFVQAVEVDNILLADENTYAYSVESVLPSQNSEGYIELTFGNNVSGIQLPKDSIVTVSFLETLGQNGNVVENNVALGTASFPTGVLYYNNFSAIIGGRVDDDLESIKLLAPRSYLTDGSLVSEDQYKQAIENIPYVRKAVVYSGTNELGKEIVEFSAIDTLGNSPIKSQIESDLLDRTLGKKSPLDILSFTPPNYLDIEINYQAKINTTKNQDLSFVASNIKNLIYNQYNIFNLGFKESIVKDRITSLVFNNTEAGLITSSNCFIEAKEILKPSTFTESFDAFFYEKSFSFDPSFEKIRQDIPIYIMRFDIIWSCVNCEFKNKTIIVTRNPEYNPSDPFSSYYLVKQYPLITAIITEEYMTSVINNPLIEPNEIVVGDPLYYPFEVEYNQTSELANTIFRIPRTYNGESYIDFDAFSADELDSEVSISCFAFPLNYTSKSIIPLTPNSIFNLTENDIKIEVS